jgi:hypothetical protein
VDERHSFAYERCDVPEGMSLAEYGRAQARKANERRRRWPLRRRHARSKSR